MRDLPRAPELRNVWAGHLADTRYFETAHEAYAAEVASWLANRLCDEDLRQVELQCSGFAGVTPAGELLGFLLLHMPDELASIAAKAAELKLRAEGT